MMNMFQLQERIKDFSKDQLVQEMQQPSGSVPPFMVLTELQRRTRMEQAFQADQAQEDQTTVAQDAINAAGVPQGGIADIAQAMAPQTDMGMNTGAAPMQVAPAEQPMMPVQGMYDGGVVRMQPGGVMEGPNTARLRELLAIYHGIGDVRRDFEIRAAREARDARRRPSLADVEPRLTPVLDEFSGLPPEMTDPTMAGSPALADIPANVASFEPSLGDYDPEAMMAINAPIGRTLGDVPDITPLPFDTSGAYAALLGAPTRAETMFGDVGPVQGPVQPPLASVSDAARMMEINEIPERPEEAELSLVDRLINSELGRTLRAGAGVTLPRMPDPENTISPLDALRRVPGVGNIEMVLDYAGLLPGPGKTPAGSPLTVPAGGIEELLPPLRTAPSDPPTPPTGPQTGGGAGGSRGALDADRMLEQDKWLALAQFGLGLMASQAPTLGGAIGEAGTAALGQFGQARQAAVARDLEERKLQAAMARASRGDGFGALSAGQGRLLSQYDTEIERLSDILSGLDSSATNEDRLTARQRLPILIEERTRLISSFSGIPFGALAGGSGAGNIRDVR